MARTSVNAPLCACEICGAEFAAKPYKSNRFCGMPCYRAWQRSPDFVSGRVSQRRAPCAHCGTEVVGRQSSTCRDGRKSDKVFCDRDCYESFRRAIRDAYIKANTTECEQCGVLCVPTQSGAPRRRFCSMACKKEHGQPDSTHCVSCGCWFSALKWLPGRGKPTRASGVKTCSNECHRQWYRDDPERKRKISEAFRGEKHPNWRGGPIDSASRGYRGPGWTRIRESIRKRDDYTCRHCGLREEEGGRAHEVHHVRPFHQFNGDNAKANRPGNLLTLCKSCHTTADWKWRVENPLQITLGLFDDQSAPAKPRYPSNLSGLVIGDMTVIDQAPNGRSNATRWRCRCGVCGGERLIWRPSIVAGRGIWCLGTRVERLAATRAANLKAKGARS